MLAPARALATALSALVLVVGGIAAAAPSVASDDQPTVSTQPAPDAALLRGQLGTGLVRPQATIEDEEAFCQWLTGVYVNHPTYYTVRVYNCRSTDIFVKGVYLNGTFGTCVLVPARALPPPRRLGDQAARRRPDLLTAGAGELHPRSPRTVGPLTRRAIGPRP